MNQKNHIGIGSRNLFHRYKENPLLTVNDWPYPANAVFNPGATVINEETLLLVRVEDYRGFSHLTTARSRDGMTNWQIDLSSTLTSSPDYHEEKWGLEDPRIVFLSEENRYAITYTSFSGGGPQVSLIVTEDFKKFERKGTLVPPEDKDAALFPKKFKGRYVLIHRPMVKGEGHIWISFSPDLTHWGEHRILIPTRKGWWDSCRVGLGTQPIETSEGWLIIYHGVRTTAAGGLYRVGLALLDLEEPWKIKKRSEEWVMGPREEYEYIGDVPGVVFPTGAVLNKETNELRIYYGAADTSIGLATAQLSEILDYLKSV
jgi:beta-1,4-mannooligosaccharide/beta-1,4-mannosyl-N-acetylglucosamine phosphorylase